MNTNNDAMAGQAKASGQRLMDDAAGSYSHVKGAATSEVRNLIADVEDLMAKIADLKDADVVRIRAKVQGAVDSTKQSLAQGTETLRLQAQRAFSSADDYVRASPWQAVGIAAVVGAVVGILTSRRS